MSAETLYARRDGALVPVGRLVHEDDDVAADGGESSEARRTSGERGSPGGPHRGGIVAPDGTVRYDFKRAARDAPNPVEVEEL